MIKHILFMLLVISWPVVAFARNLPRISVPMSMVKPQLLAAPDEVVWQSAAVIPNLTLSRGPDGNGLKPLPTSVRLLWDTDYFYLRFCCTDSELYLPISGRDAELYKGDVVEVFLDPVGDARSYIELQVNPRGEIFDQIFSITTKPRSNSDGRLIDDVLTRNWWPNVSWTLEGLKVSTRFVDTPLQKQWIVDLAIPATSVLRRLGKSQFEPLTMRANFMRYEWALPAQEKQERRLMAMNWASVIYGCPHISPQAMGFVTLQPASYAVRAYPHLLH